MRDRDQVEEFEGLEFDDIAFRMTAEIMSSYLSSNQLPLDRVSAVSLSVFETISSLSKENFAQYQKSKSL